MNEDKIREYRRKTRQEIGLDPQPQDMALPDNSGPYRRKHDIDLGFIGNIPNSAMKLGEGLLSMAAHPIDTLGNVANLAVGAGQKAGILPGSGKEKYADALIDYYKQNYQSPGSVWDYFYEDPLAPVMDASMFLTGGGMAAAKGAMLAGKAGKLANAASKLDKFANMSKKAGLALDPLSRVFGGTRAALGLTPAGQGGMINRFLASNPFARVVRDTRTAAGNRLFDAPLIAAGLKQEKIDAARPYLQEIDGSPYTQKGMRQLKGNLSNAAEIRDAEIAKTALPERRAGEIFEDEVQRVLGDNTTELNRLVDNPFHPEYAESVTKRKNQFHEDFHDPATDTVSWETEYGPSTVTDEFGNPYMVEVGKKKVVERAPNTAENTITLSRSRAGELASKTQANLKSKDYEQSTLGSITKALDKVGADALRKYSLEGISEKGRAAHEKVKGLSGAKEALEYVVHDPENAFAPMNALATASLGATGGTMGGWIAARQAARSPLFRNRLLPRIGKKMARMGEKQKTRGYFLPYAAYFYDQNIGPAMDELARREREERRNRSRIERFNDVLGY